MSMQLDERKIRTGDSSWMRRFAKATIIALLQKMPKGRLEIQMPDGQCQTFGAGIDSFSPVAKIVVHSDEFFERCLLFGDLGLAEAYLDGLCDLHSIRSVISWFLLNQDSVLLNESKTANAMFNLLGVLNKIGHALRDNSIAKSKTNIAEHYDLGNDFFKLFLDESMAYSSGLYTRDYSLHDAQLAKFERIAKELRIAPGDRVLDLGCGWGGLTCYLAQNFDCSLTALTISQQQYDYTSKLIADLDLKHKIDLRLEDYRLHSGLYDKIVSIEMIEAVGEKYMDQFIQKVDSLLVRDGLLLMQMITSADSRYEVLRSNVDFIQKHIFPGSILPSLYRVNTAMVKCGELFLVDLADLSNSYVRTLRAWQDNFVSHRAQLRAMGFDDKFIRKWLYYFEYCQAAFAMRNVSVVQALYSRPNNPTLSHEWNNL